MEVVEFKDVYKKMGDFELTIPSLGIKKGYITGFVGENGAGKTTTIKLVMDMLLPDKGTIKVFGMSTKEKGELIREDIGYVGDPAGYPEESKIRDIKRMIAPFYKSWDDDLFKKYVKRFDVDINKKYGELSTGKKKQFALVMALAHRPKLIMLDEPTANLDPVVRNEILEIIMEHMQNEEVTTFYSTHITSDLEKTADYIVYIKNGKIIFNEEKEKLAMDYCVVKGPKDLLDEEVKNSSLGIKQTSFGFEALFADRQRAKDLFGSEAVYGSPTIEEIMVFLSQKKGE